MITLYLHANHNEVAFTKKDYLLRAAERLGLGDYVINYSEHSGIVPEYVLNIEPYNYLVTGSKWTGLWEIDVMLDRQEMNLDRWINSDTVFVANNSYPERMKSFHGNLVTMFQACDPFLHKRIPSIPQNFDFVFAGSVGLEIYRERERLMQFLREHNFSFHDFGKGMKPEVYVEHLNEAKVQFIRSGQKLPIANSQVEQRFFECLAIGPVLKDYTPDLEQLGLVEGTDFYWYKTDEELLEKMTYLLDHPEFAKVMATNGRNKALLYHTYENRLMSIIRFAQEHVHA